jgi:F-type H+-transporting ATPase subunit epsilon
MADGNKLRVRLVTPEKILVEDTADAVELPAKSGYMEVLYGHAPLMAELGAGDVTLHGIGGSEPTRYNVSWGFVEVLPDRVTILASDAIEPSAIDVPRAQKQLEHGQELWSQAGDSAEKYEEAEHVINEAEAKLASAAGSGQH